MADLGVGGSYHLLEDHMLNKGFNNSLVAALEIWYTLGPTHGSAIYHIALVGACRRGLNVLMS